jgi:hypothetical protein
VLREGAVDASRPYFQSARADAREHFHKAVRISLHPEKGEMGADATLAELPSGQIDPRAVRRGFGRDYR